MVGYKLQRKCTHLHFDGCGSGSIRDGGAAATGRLLVRVRLDTHRATASSIAAPPYEAEGGAQHKDSNDNATHHRPWELTRLRPTDLWASLWRSQSDTRGTELDSLLGLVPLQPVSARLLCARIGGDVDVTC